MFDPSEEFRKFATKDRGISSTTLDRFSVGICQLHLTNHY